MGSNNVSSLFLKKSDLVVEGGPNFILVIVMDLGKTLNSAIENESQISSPLLVRCENLGLKITLGSGLLGGVQEVVLLHAIVAVVVVLVVVVTSSVAVSVSYMTSGAVVLVLSSSSADEQSSEVCLHVVLTKFIQKKLWQLNIRVYLIQTV